MKPHKLIKGLQYKLGLLVIIVTMLFNSFTTWGQVSRERAIGAYIYNFIKKTNWPNEESMGDFQIVTITESEKIKEEFKLVMRDGSVVKKHQIRQTFTTDPNIDLSNAQLVYLHADKGEFIEEIFDRISGKPILLVTYRNEDKRLVMLNLYDTKENTIRFEMNKPNIYNQNLEVDDEILALGGSEIDVLNLFLKSQKTLRDLEKTAADLRSQLENREAQLEQLSKQIEQSTSTINSQKKTINDQKGQLKLLSGNAERLKQEIKEQQRQLLIEKSELAKLSDSLSSTNDQLNLQLAEIDEGLRILAGQEFEINEMNKRIAEKDAVLKDQDVTIVQQQRVVYIFGGLIFLIAGLSLVLVKALVNNRKKNKILRSQKDEISTKNEKLRETISKLESTQEQLVQSEKMASLGVLTAGIAHEINNPVNFVYTGATNLKQEFEDLNIILNEINSLESGDEEKDERVKRIQKLKDEYGFEDIYTLLPQIIDDITVGAERITEIVKGLRNFSRMDLDEHSDSDVHKIIEGTLILLKNEYKHRIKMVTNYDVSLPTIECNFGKISQVILNIINNAIDAIEDTGTITLSTKRVDDNISISIKDDGIGMNTDTLEKIFDPFFTTKAVGKGTGLGLSISYGIIQDHNGTLKVNSSVGKGTEFIITLPINQKM